MNGQVMVLKQGVTFKRVMPTIQIAEIPHEIERSFMRRVVLGHMDRVLIARRATEAA
jgi:hypothetical protein